MKLVYMVGLIAAFNASCKAIKEGGSSSWSSPEAVDEFICHDGNCAQKNGGLVHNGDLANPVGRFSRVIKRSFGENGFRFRFNNPGFRFIQKRSVDPQDEGIELGLMNPLESIPIDEDNENFEQEMKPTPKLRPLYQYSRLLKRARFLGSEMMNDLSYPSDDMKNFRFRSVALPDQFRFRVADKRMDKAWDSPWVPTPSPTVQGPIYVNDLGIPSNLRNQLQNRQTRNNEVRYLQWRKITGKK